MFSDGEKKRMVEAVRGLMQNEKTRCVVDDRK